MGEELKPCPFCGSTSAILTADDEDPCFYVVCDNCTANGPDHGTRAAALAAWNTRAGEGEVRAKALEEAADHFAAICSDEPSTTDRILGAARFFGQRIVADLRARAAKEREMVPPMVPAPLPAPRTGAACERCGDQRRVTVYAEGRSFEEGREIACPDCGLARPPAGGAK